MPGTTPAVLNVTRRFEMPNAKSSVRIEAARTALSKFNNGSPIPIMTTLVTPRSSPSPRNTSDASTTCPTISAADRLPLKPCLPVEQKLQSSTQPTCDDTHNVLRPRSGMSTASTALPFATFNAHLRVPSTETRSLTISGNASDAVCVRLSRSFFDRSVIAANSRTPR